MFHFLDKVEHVMTYPSIVEVDYKVTPELFAFNIEIRAHLLLKAKRMKIYVVYIPICA